MTNEEAIKKLRFEADGLCHGCVHPSMVGWCENHCQLPQAFEMAIKALEQPKIIRCKDCRHFSEDNLMGYHTCPLNNAIEVGHEDYCSLAERREDGAE